MLRRIKRKFPVYKKLIVSFFTSFFDLVLFYTSRIKVFHDPDGKDIIFFADNTRLEIIRYAKYLKPFYNIVLVIPHTRVGRNFPSNLFKQVIHFRNHWHFRRIINQLENVKLAHGFIRSSKAAKVFMKTFEIPVVISCKDLTVSYFGHRPPYLYFKLDVKNESFALKKANGLIAESLELNNALRSYQIATTQKKLLFPLYLDNEKMYPFHNKLQNKSPLKIIYIGVIHGKGSDDKRFGAQKFFNLIENFAKQDVEFHVYPNFGLPRAVYSDYYELSDKFPNFFMHNPVPYDQLHKELQNYDIGIIPFFQEDTKRAIEKLKYGISLKLFNYMEAGLPVLISKDIQFQMCIAKKMGLAIPIQKNDLKDIKKTIDRNVNLIDNRNKYTLDNQINRLNRFYESISSGYEKMKNE